MLMLISEFTIAINTYIAVEEIYYAFPGTPFLFIRYPADSYAPVAACLVNVDPIQ